LGGMARQNLSGKNYKEWGEQKIPKKDGEELREGELEGPCQGGEGLNGERDPC